MPTSPPFAPPARLPQPATKVQRCADSSARWVGHRLVRPHLSTLAQFLAIAVARRNGPSPRAAACVSTSGPRSHIRSTLPRAICLHHSPAGTLLLLRPRRPRCVITGRHREQHSCGQPDFSRRPLSARRRSASQHAAPLSTEEAVGQLWYSVRLAAFLGASLGLFLFDHHRKHLHASLGPCPLPCRRQR